MGDISDIERKDKDPSSVSHIRNMIKMGHSKLARKTTICINKTDAETLSMEQSSNSGSNFNSHHHHYILPCSPDHRATSGHPAPPHHTHGHALTYDHHHSAP